ncbi:TPA: ribokinase [Candidatus Poribacteria bacterium]|nr:ribokinase [Candidatus Poribacteria bacterium]
MSKPKITVIGSSNTDLVARVSRMPALGETILGAEFITAPGGKGANQAVAAARLGGEVTLIAKLGRDAFGEEAIENFKRDDIITDFVFRDEQTPSGVALIFVDEAGENTIAVASGANANLSTEEIDQAKAAIETADAVLLQLEIPLQTVEHTISIASAANIPIVLNPAPAQPPSPIFLNEKLTFLTPNEVEASLLSGIQVQDKASAENAGRELLKYGISHIILTLGDMGAMLVNAEKSMPFPTKQVEVVDTTAAGDVFNGAFAYAIAKGEKIENAIRFANAAATLSVTRLGAQPSIPTADEVSDFI